MREIKFRLWCENNKEWEQGEWIICPNGALLEMKFGRNVMLRKKTHKLTQFTGLKDKNGVEIYEGDAIKANYKTGSVRDIKGYVVIHNGMVQLQLNKSHNYYKINTSKCPFRKLFNIEVIGNIYQNKNLLEVE